MVAVVLVEDAVSIDVEDDVFTVVIDAVAVGIKELDRIGTKERWAATDSGRARECEGSFEVATDWLTHKTRRWHEGSEAPIDVKHDAVKANIMEGVTDGGGTRATTWVL